MQAAHGNLLTNLPPDGSAEVFELLHERAGLTLEGSAEEHIMQPGAWLHIPAHCRHRIEWTDAGQPTIWLAVHHETVPL